MNGVQGLGLFFMIAGGLFSLHSFRAVVRRRALWRRPVKVEGVVVRLIEPTNDADSGPRVTPVVRYTVDGQSYEEKLAEIHEDGVFLVGKKVHLVYEQGNPGNVTDVDCRWEDVVIHMVASVLAMAFGVVLYFFTTVT